MTDDVQLLRRFVAESSEAAFRDLVTRRIDFVYAAALRQVSGDSHLAQEVTQSVFLDLARKAHALAPRPTITGWLYTSVRYAAAKALRTRSRRINHETEAHAMQQILSAGSHAEINWNELRPVIDAAMHELGESDREAILLRYFEGRPLAEVGVAIGLDENSARMRVNRALEKLRTQLAQRGITSTAAALGVTLANQPVVAAPAGLARIIASGSLSGVVGATEIIATLKTMNTLKLIASLVAAGAAGGVGTYLVTHSHDQGRNATAATQTIAASLWTENQRLKNDVERLTAELSVREVQLISAARPSNNPLVRLAILADVQKRGLVQPMFDILSTDGNAKLTPAFIELFQLTSEEQQVLQQIVTNARLQVSQLTVASATVQRTSDVKLVIDIPPTPEGEAAGSALLETFARVLGPERQAAFAVLGLNEFQRAMNQFGAEHRKITITRNEAASGKPLWDLKDEQVSLHGKRSFNTSVGLEGLPLRIRPFEKLIPPDFGGAK